MKKFLFKIIKTILLFITKISYRLLKVDKIYYSFLYQNISNIPTDVHYCLILGALLFDDDSITPILTERLNAAIEIYKQRPSTVFILSGDGTKRISNDVKAMYAYLKSNSDIPDSQIIFDNEGVNSSNSIKNAIALTGNAGLILLTSAFHMPRCTYICHKLKCNAFALHLPPQKTTFPKKYIIREQLALLKFLYLYHFENTKFEKFRQNISFTISILVGKLCYKSLRLIKHQSTFSLPGRIALKICPSVLQDITHNISLILITGTMETNSTSHFVKNTLQKNNISFFCNHSCTNSRFGIATTLLVHCNILGKYKENFVVLECDAIDFPKITCHFKAKDISLIITSLEQPQQPLSKSLKYIHQHILCGIDYLPDAHLYLNSDCLLTEMITEQVNNIFSFYNSHSMENHKNDFYTEIFSPNK